MCVKENEVKRDSDKESEIERVWPAMRKKECDSLEGVTYTTCMRAHAREVGG